MSDPTDDEQAAAEAGLVRGTAGGPYCSVCGAPAEHDPLDIADGPGFTTVPGVLRCPNRCDPRLNR